MCIRDRYVIIELLNEGGIVAQEPEGEEDNADVDNTSILNLGFSLSNINEELSLKYDFSPDQKGLVVTVIDNQSVPVNFVGHQRENLIFVAAVYWIFTFTLSRRSMKVEKRLGLGER